MKGIVFNLLEHVVTDEFGADTWDDLIDIAGVDGVYTSLGSYPDEDLGKLVMAASEKTGMTPDDIVRWFGERTLPIFAERYPDLFTAHANTREFLLHLNDVIHPEVKKLYPGAATPSFSYDTSSPDVLVMEYRSGRHLCSFAEGLVSGTAEHYGEALAIDHDTCMKRGDDRCVLAVSHPG